MSPGAKKLVLVSAASMSVTKTRGEAVESAETAGEEKNGKESR